MHINNWLRDINNGYEICYKKKLCEIKDVIENKCEM